MVTPTEPMSVTGQEAGLLTAISPQEPCGVSIDEDPQFLLLTSGLQPRADAQYGDFYEPAESINWTDVEATTRKLLQKSRDIRLVIILTRCRIRIAGAQALVTGLSLLQEMLTQWPEDLHPQLMDEGEFTPQLRANAFAELNDIHGLMADIRQLALPKTAGIQVTLRDLEKAATLPRPEDALSAELITHLQQQWQETADAEWQTIQQAAECAEQLSQQIQQNLAEYAPDLSVLCRLLSLCSPRMASAVSTSQPAVLPQSTDSEPEVNHSRSAPEIPRIMPQAKLTAGQALCHREDVVSRLQELRQWFSESEPGSPAIPMLAYIEKSLGKSFSELVAMYPPEIISLLNNK